ncbi:MAG TPA: GTP-binding protein [Candidatus Omnitrophota bacterium]|nr:GTP-binding protein [Candidatus Omnitrophota bacterium]HPT39232.1 GTP-binding protein [Candidatus Omnitrophota bacterium]
MPNLIKIVVAGDVDSGKSTLIGRYLYESGSLNQGAVEDVKQVCKNLERNFEFAYLLDSFEEEREKELTIDTTQCFCKTDNHNSMVFIDVPGHQELLKNMLSGASYADIAILTIDINKSVKDQTKRHTFLLKFLGITQIITVINKMDLRDFSEADFLETKKQVAQVFKKLHLEFNACLPVSAGLGDNLFKPSEKMPWYRGKSLRATLNGIKIKKNSGDFRFLIQDSYKNNGKSIAAGIVTSGSIKINQKVFILPEQKTDQVKTIKYSDKNIRSASGPLAIGIILKKTNYLKRGQILCSNQLPQITKTIRGKIICTRPINLNTPLNFHCAVQKTKVTIDRIDQIWDTVNLLPKSGPLKENDLAQVVLKTAGKVAIESYDHLNSLGKFVLVDNCQRIAAIGTVL